MKVRQLDHLNLSVRSFEETADWYRRVFGFEVVQDETDESGARWGVLRSGDALLCVYEHGNLRAPKREDVRAAGFHSLAHFALRITDREAWERTIERENLDLRWGGLVRWPHSQAWYVEDPTGWEIEVALWDGDEISFG